MFVCVAKVGRQEGYVCEGVECVQRQVNVKEVTSCFPVMVYSM